MTYLFPLLDNKLITYVKLFIQNKTSPRKEMNEYNSCSSGPRYQSV